MVLAAGQDYYYFHRVEAMDAATGGTGAATDFGPCGAGGLVWMQISSNQWR